MRSLLNSLILKYKPKEYLVQGPSHCGAYSVKAILSAYGLDTKNHPKEYHSHWLGKLTGGTFGRNYYVRILKSHGIRADVKSAEEMFDNDRLYLLKNLLSQNTPVMIRIGNGYFLSTIYNPILGKIVPHWITLWGYDDKEQIFYVYDSGMLKEHWRKNTPVGNTIRTYKEVLRDWNFGKNQPWTWPFTLRANFLYIQVESTS